MDIDYYEIHDVNLMDIILILPNLPLQQTSIIPIPVANKYVRANALRLFRLLRLNIMPHYIRISR